MLGKYSECRELLDQVHDRFGFSLWEIQNQIALANEVSGLDGQKQLTKDFLSELQKNSIISYHINSFSRQCESNVSINTFFNGVDSDYRRFLSQGTPLDLCKYVKYKLNGYLLTDDVDILNESTLAYFLFIDDKNALIDRYISFSTILSSVLKGPNSSIQSKFIEHLPSLIVTISDPFLKNSYYLAHHNYACYHSKIE